MNFHIKSILIYSPSVQRLWNDIGFKSLYHIIIPIQGVYCEMGRNCGNWHGGQFEAQILFNGTISQKRLWYLWSCTVWQIWSLKREKWLWHLCGIQLLQLGSPGRTCSLLDLIWVDATVALLSLVLSAGVKRNFYLAFCCSYDTWGPYSYVWDMTTEAKQFNSHTSNF